MYVQIRKISSTQMSCRDDYANFLYWIHQQPKDKIWADISFFVPYVSTYLKGLQLIISRKTGYNSCHPVREIQSEALTKLLDLAFAHPSYKGKDMKVPTLTEVWKTQITEEMKAQV